MTESGTDQRTPAAIALYYYDGCAFCEAVRSVARRVGAALELRNIRTKPEYRRELKAATGRTTVPVLKIEAPEGATWLRESSAIIVHLKRQAGASPESAAMSRWLVPRASTLALGAAGLALIASGGSPAVLVLAVAGLMLLRWLTRW